MVSLLKSIFVHLDFNTPWLGHWEILWNFRCAENLRFSSIFTQEALILQVDLNPDAIAGRRVSITRSTRLSDRGIGKIYIAELIVTPLRVSGFCFTGLSGRFYFFKLLFLTYKCKKGKAGSLGGDFFLPAFEKHAWCLE